MGYYGERKYKALWILGYIVLLGITAVLCYTYADVIIAHKTDPENAGWSMVGLVLVWAAFAPFLAIPLLFGIIGWILTARNNLQPAKRYILLTFLPLVVAGASFGAMYLF